MLKKILFYRVNDPYGYMSNFAPYPFILNGKEWKTSEHYFQAMKFNDLEYSEKIRNIESPMIAAKMGRDRSIPLKSDWESIKDSIMKKAVYEKFYQNLYIKKLLIETGTAEIIEHTVNDHYWADGGDGTGLNMLGKILMNVRRALSD